jgi:hypothetical protein
MRWRQVSRLRWMMACLNSLIVERLKTSESMQGAGVVIIVREVHFTRNISNNQVVHRVSWGGVCFDQWFKEKR